MDKNELVSKARDLISEGNTEQALDMVEAFLGKDAKYQALYKEAVFLSGLQNKTSLEQSKRIISFDNAELNFGNVRQGLLHLLDFIENDEFAPTGLKNVKAEVEPPQKSIKKILVIGIPVLLLAATAVYYFAVGKNEGTASAQGDGNVCTVAFQDTVNSKNFLILPFFKPSGGEFQPEGLVIDRLAQFTKGIESFRNSAFEICSTYKPDRPLDYDAARQTGLANKATVVIWGLIDKNGNTTAVKTRYKYLGNKDIDGKVPFIQLKQSGNFKDEGEQTVVTEGVLSVIASSGELTQDLETTLKLMVGMVAQLEGDRQGALAAMESVDLGIDTSASANLMKYMIIADNYIAENKPEKAKAALDTCLMVNETYWLGRNNRANLMIKSGDYLAAIEDLNAALAKRPEDAEMLLARGVAFKKSEQLYEAKKDFEKVVKIKPEKEPALRKTIEETDIEIKRLERLVEPTRIKMTESRATKTDVVTAAEASNKLGNIAMTKQLVAKGLELDQNNSQLIAVQIDNLLKENQIAKAKEVLKAALFRDVKIEAIAKHNKNVAAFIRREDL